MLKSRGAALTSYIFQIVNAFTSPAWKKKTTLLSALAWTTLRSFAGTHEAPATFPAEPLSERTQRTARLRPGRGVAVSPGLPGEARLQLRRSQKHLTNLRGTAGVPPPTRCSSKNGLQEAGTSFSFSILFLCLFPRCDLRVVYLLQAVAPSVWYQAAFRILRPCPESIIDSRANVSSPQSSGRRMRPL